MGLDEALMEHGLPSGSRSQKNSEVELPGKLLEGVGEPGTGAG